MKVKAYLDKRVIDRTFSLLNKKPLIANRLLQFINQCDELHTYHGMWEKDSRKKDFLRMLGSSGNTLRQLTDKTNFKDYISGNSHFSIGITSDEEMFKVSTPVMSFDELVSCMEQCDQNAFYIKTEDDFRGSALIHQPTSIIINDRYFFEGSYPEEYLNLIIENIIDADYRGCIVITIFYSKPDKLVEANLSRSIHSQLATTGYKEIIEEKKEIVSDELKLCFPNTEFVIEVIENDQDTTHDRFIFTDFLCYKSEKSFHFLTNQRQSSVIHRYPIFEGVNFINNVKYLEEFLSRSSKVMSKSKNPIIRSFLGKEMEVVK